MIKLSAPLSTQDCLREMAKALEDAGLYFGHGTDNAWDEACWLLETLLRRQGAAKFQPDTLLNADDLAPAEAMLNERIDTRRPLAYLLGEAWFCGLPFHVDDSVLVPRSPLAELIRNGFEPVLKEAPARILDLCTGSGCIGIACAMAFPEAEVVLTDISPEALAVARRNVERHGLEGRVQVVQADVFEGLSGTFDLIVSNPPYVPEEEYQELPAEFHREPKLGLVTADEGLEIPLRILDKAADFLKADGLLVLETGLTWAALALRRLDLPFLWLEFEYGGQGVCALTREQLVSASREGG